MTSSTCMGQNIRWAASALQVGQAMLQANHVSWADGGMIFIHDDSAAGLLMPQAVIEGCPSA